MNDPIDDKALDEYLARGSEVSRRYRELGGDEVPPELDRRVLAEARAAAAKGQGGARAWLRWGSPIALAASAVLVLSIVMQSGVEQKTITPAKPAGYPQPPREVAEEAATASADSPSPELYNIMPAAPEPAVREREAANDALAAAKRDQAERKLEDLAPSRAVAPAEDERTFAARAVTVRVEAPPQVAEQSTAIAQTAAAAPAPPMATLEGQSAELDEARVAADAPRAASEGAGPRSTSPPGRLARDLPAAGQQGAVADRALERMDRTDPERWLEEIRQLRRDRKSREADREWERFRAAFPDYAVAADDIAAKRP